MKRLGGLRHHVVAPFLYPSDVRVRMRVAQTVYMKAVTIDHAVYCITCVSAGPWAR